MDIDELMLHYGKRGLKDWKRWDDAMQKNARQRLGNRIAESDPEMNFALSRDRDHARFIPMPRHPSPSRDLGFFFTPLRRDNVVSFELVCVAGEICFGLRFEPPEDEGTHRYTHFQFTQRMLRKTHRLSAMPPLPLSYPAFPTGTSDTFELFLYIVMAVHGYHGGAWDLLRDIYGKASKLSHWGACTDHMRKVLAVAAEPGHQ